MDEAGLRPTAERIRETLFNWLAPTIAGSRCLDLFAGSGALGFEALSRGAATAVFVERAPAATAQLARSIGTLGAEGATVVGTDACRFLAGPAPPSPFDIVFIDPPFANADYTELCRLLARGGWLAGNARVYLEMPGPASLPELPAGWRILRDKRAGNVRFVLIAVTGDIE